MQTTKDTVGHGSRSVELNHIDKRLCIDIRIKEKNKLSISSKYFILVECT